MTPASSRPRRAGAQPRRKWTLRVPATLPVLATLTLLGACEPASNGRPGDVLFTNARVIDGTGTPSRVADVRVRGDRILEIGDLALGEGETQVIATGLVLAPGFIDTHSHHDRGLTRAGDALAVVSQGITTIIVGQDGGSPLPLSDFFAELEATPAAVNVAAYAGHNSLRSAVMGEDFRREATPAEVDEMRTLLRRELEAGALGLSTGLEYDPGIYSNPEEVVALAREAAAVGGRYISHMRSEDRAFFEALGELLHIGRETGIPVQISHMKLAMKSLWGRTDEVLALLDAARAEGINVTADVYPYEFWQSTMTVLFPDRAFTREAATFALDELAPPDGMIIAAFEPDPSYVGMTLAEVAERRGKDAVTVYLELIAEVDAIDGRESIIARSMTTEDIASLLSWPFTNVSSDGALAGRHPRGYGAFTRVLAQHVRDRNDFSLETAIRKMTALAAHNTGLSDRGTLEEGAFADLVLLDPSTVADRATPENPNTPSVGIVGVWVNGERVYSEAGTTGNRPGRVLRRGSFDRAAVDAVFADLTASPAPGCALGIVQNGALVYGRGYGMANLEHNIPITTRSVFRTGSVSKQFTAAVVAIAAMEGHLSLDDPMRKWIPELPDYGRVLTIRHALNHTSGLRDYLTLMSLRGLRDDDFYTGEELIAVQVRQEELNFPPGSEYLYSNSGYFLLTEAVARAVGKPFNEYAEDVVFAPLGMTHSHFHDDHDHIVPLRADGYAPLPGGGFRTSMTTLDMIGDGGVYTSIEDMVSWVDALETDALRPGLSRTLETRGVLTSGEQIDYAMGQRHSEYRGLATVGHGGSFVGFRADVLRFPSEHTSIVTLCNRADGRPSARALAVADVVLADRLGPRPPERERGAGGRGGGPTASPVGDTSPYVGTYHSPELDVDYDFVHVDGALVVRAGAGIDDAVLRIAGDTLRAGRMTFRFIRAGDEVTGFELDAGRVVHVRFERIGGDR